MPNFAFSLLPELSLFLGLRRALHRCPREEKTGAIVGVGKFKGATCPGRNGGEVEQQQQPQPAPPQQLPAPAGQGKGEAGRSTRERTGEEGGRDGQSKMVSRYQQQSESEAHSSDYSSSNFWDRLSQQPSPHWMEEYHEAPSLLTSGCVVQQPAEAERDPFPWQMVSTVQKLPSPKELCRRKKKGRKLKRLENVRSLSVCYHLEELRRKQSSIDELKKATWGLCVPQPLHEGAEGTADSLTKATYHKDQLSPFSMLKPAAQFYENHPAFNKPNNAQLLYPEWNPTMREQLMIPSESPMISYTMATRDRCQRAAGCRSEEDYWGFKLQSEE
ncbi:protein INCA1 [Rhineura floridana]|uniref:protein INCA1 n=1 Tax=Rhineura floridana TaxID=261503 RepID=UPI002AC89327|nr:protein INCA1 [Rhineura floridana]